MARGTRGHDSKKKKNDNRAKAKNKHPSAHLVILPFMFAHLLDVKGTKEIERLGSATRGTTGTFKQHFSDSHGK